MTDLFQGYALMRRPTAALHRYEGTDFARENAEELRTLRAALSFVDPATYRGISRDPLQAFPDLDAKQIRDLERRGVDCHTNERARRLLRQFGVPASDEDPSDPYLVPTRSAADQIFDLLQNPEEYELVTLSRNRDGLDTGTLGFDVGYWGSDHFSLICDTSVMPRWHPPDPVDYDELAARLRGGLNAHVLFNTYDDAAAFRSHYMTKSWAETEFEPGQFCVIAVGGA